MFTFDGADFSPHGQIHTEFNNSGATDMVLIEIAPSVGTLNYLGMCESQIGPLEPMSV